MQVVSCISSAVEDASSARTGCVTEASSKHVKAGAILGCRDRIVAGFILMTLAPLLLIVAIAIVSNSRGPILFRQLRTGFGGKRFNIYKFRSMYVQENGPNIRQATKLDPRVTAVGHVLRKTSIDELPQLFNVIRGEMALVGPRPHALAHDEYYSRRIPAYIMRYAVKPGLTGWAQVNGSRGETPTIEHMQRRIALDLWYIENRSLLIDLSIFFRTASIIFLNREQAY